MNRPLLLVMLSLPLVVWWFSPNRSFAESIAIAVPSLPITSTMSKWMADDDQEPYFEVLHSASAPPLVSSSTGDTAARIARINQLSFVQSLQSDPDTGTLVIRLREDVTFSNGEMLFAEDAIFSLLSCRRDQMTRQSESHPSIRIEGEPGEPLMFTLYGDVTETTRLLLYCPIFEKNSGQIFGDLLGNANFFVGLGPYQVSKMKPGVRIALQKVKDAWTNARQYSLSGQFVDELEVRMIPDPRRALTALRFGSIDLVFSKNDEIQELAKSDATLSVAVCRGHDVIYRKGLRLDCEDVRWVSRLRYVG